MSEINSKINDTLGEHREHVDLVTATSTVACSQLNSDNGNSGNNLLNIINPFDIPPPQPNIIEILRPSNVCHKDWFNINGKNLQPGLYWHGILKDDTAVDIYIADPILIEAITSNYDGNEFGRLLKFQDVNGAWHKWSMPMRMLKSNGEEVLEILRDQGFIYNRKKSNELINHFMIVKPTSHIKAASQVGWYGDTFVLPNRTIGNEKIVFQSEYPGYDDFKASGTIESWKNEIGTKCSGNKLLIVSVSAALSGVLFKMLNRHQGGGIHLVGDSSSGKSTCIEVAASIWGPPSFVRSWSATGNGLEGIAATRNDSCLILDEIDEALPQEISKIIYMLVNGQGKQRANRNGQAKGIQRWRTMTLSTGERTFSGIMAENNKQPNSGQLVRLININANFKYGVFEDLHGFSGGRELADHFKVARNTNCGVIGPQFVECLLHDKEEDILLLRKSISDQFKLLVSNNLENRAASTCEIIALAGELAIKYGLFPLEKGSAISASVEVFNRWKNGEDSGKTEDQRIISSVSTFIDQFADLRFTNIKEENKINNRAGWISVENGITVYMFCNHALKEAGGNYQASRIAQALIRAGWIIDHDKDRLTKKTRIKGEFKNLYHVKIPADADLNV